MLKFLKKHFRLRYQNVYVHAKKLFIFDIFLLCLALFMLMASIFFFFWRPGITDLIDIQFSFGGERLTSGQEMTIAIDYQNRSKLILNNAEMAVKLPNGFIIDRNLTPISEFSEQHIFNLNQIKAGGSGQLQIHGVFYAEPGADNKITAYLTYIPEEKTSKEQKISGAIVRTVDSVLTTEIHMLEKTFPNKKIPITIKITNNDTKKLGKISLKTNWTEAFTQKNTENLSLKAGESLEFKGEITAPDSSGEYTYAGLVNIVINNQAITQAVFSKKFSVFYPDLSIYTTFPDSGVKYLEPGTEIPLVVGWKNNSQFDLQNLQISLSFNPNIVNLSDTARENNLRVSGNSLIIDNKSRTALADGQPGGKDEFTINLILLPSFGAVTKNAALEAKAQISAQISGETNQTFTKEAVSNSFPLATEVSFSSEARYYTSSGDQLGRGPLPPTVGETTKYWIFNKITNGTNEIKDLSFTAKLADGVKLGEKQSVTLGGKMNYNENSNTITWNFDSAPALSEIGLYFEVSVTPIISQVGEKIKLVDYTNFSTTDTRTGKKFNLSEKDIFNILLSNDRGGQKGYLVTE